MSYEAEKFRRDLKLRAREAREKTDLPPANDQWRREGRFISQTDPADQPVYFRPAA